MGVIKVEQIKTYAFHGCLDEEARIGGNYLVDVELETDLDKAAATDNLNDTVDYGVITSIVLREMKIRSKLIESVGGRIINQIKSTFPQCRSVMVRVIKLKPPVNGNVERVSVELKA